VLLTRWRHVRRTESRQQDRIRGLCVPLPGRGQSALKIEVLSFDTKGKIVNTKPYDYKATTPAWQPTGLVGINVFSSKSTVAAAPVAFRFTPTTRDSRYQVDDVYVDPRTRG
jgi:hypothetical protein